MHLLGPKGWRAGAGHRTACRSWVLSAPVPPPHLSRDPSPPTRSAGIPQKGGLPVWPDAEGPNPPAPGEGVLERRLAGVRRQAVRGKSSEPAAAARSPLMTGAAAELLAARQGAQVPAPARNGTPGFARPHAPRAQAQPTETPRRRPTADGCSDASPDVLPSGEAVNALQSACRVDPSRPSTGTEGPRRGTGVSPTAPAPRPGTAQVRERLLSEPQLRLADVHAAALRCGPELDLEAELDFLCTLLVGIASAGGGGWGRDTGGGQGRRGKGRHAPGPVAAAAGPARKHAPSMRIHAGAACGNQGLGRYHAVPGGFLFGGGGSRVCRTGPGERRAPAGVAGLWHAARAEQAPHRARLARRRAACRAGQSPGARGGRELALW